MADIFGAFGAGRSGPGRYKKPASSRKILGVQATPTLTVIDDASAGGETASWTKNIDYTSYSYGAVISLVNGTGATRYLSTVQVRGKPVEMLQGDEGLIHDAFQDHDSIYENGERKVEWGNDSIVTMAQTNQVADFLWKEFRSKKHVYMLSLPGTRYNYEPGDWYWLTIGGVGQPEYLDSLVQVYQVETYRAAAELGNTMIILKEVQEAWKKDSTAMARFIASGRTYQLPAGMEIRIGSQYATDKCDVYCDGTSDKDEINTAITRLSESYGGGVVHLTRGTFNIDGSIVPKGNVIIEGEGAATIITGDNSITLFNSTGEDNLHFRNFAINHTGTQAAVYTFLLPTCDNLIMEDIYVTACPGFIANTFSGANGRIDGLYVAACLDAGLNITGNDWIINNYIFNGSGTKSRYGLSISGARCSGNNIQIKTLDRSSTGAGTNLYGFLCTGSNCSFTNIVIDNMGEGYLADIIYGVALGGNDNALSNVYINDIDNDDAGSGYGLYISGDRNKVNNYYVTGCAQAGVYVAAAADKTMLSGGISTGNGTNYTDGGTNTQIAAVDNT
jgi:hypothetical protein